MILFDLSESVALVTLNRPESRNALTGAMIAELAHTLIALDDNPAVRCIVLTGADPAFCAGLDLRDLSSSYRDAMIELAPGRSMRGLMPLLDTPVIGAINGAAVTGGLELALSCDFLIASERATFADTHSRVGVMPGGGMSIRLPQLIGINRARQMSLTGNFVDAATARDWGLVNEVVPHAELLGRCDVLARAIAESAPESVREIRQMYRILAHRGDDDVFADESRWSRQWMKERFSAERFEEGRSALIERGSSQQ